MSNETPASEDQSGQDVVVTAPPDLVAPEQSISGLTEEQQRQAEAFDVVPGCKPGYPFLSSVGKMGSFASELRTLRNDAAHNEPLSDDDACRALDTRERVLKPSVVRTVQENATTQEFERSGCER